MELNGRIMVDMSIAQLVEATGGHLQMATLPPLGGMWEPVQGLTGDSRLVQPGHVFWDLDSASTNAGIGHAVHAFMHSALGVVTSRWQLQPWAGAFCLHVPDTALALASVGKWLRRRFAGPVVVCPGNAADECNSSLIQQVLHDRHRGTTHHVADDTKMAMVSTLLEMDALADYAIFKLPCATKLSGFENSDLCCPDIVAITGPQLFDVGDTSDEHAAIAATGRWLSKLPEDTCLILDADDPRLCWAALDCPANVLWIGSNDRLDLAAKCIRTRGTTSQFVIDGRLLQIEHPVGFSVQSMMVAIVVGMQFGVEPAFAAMSLSDGISQLDGRRARVA